MGLSSTHQRVAGLKAFDPKRIRMCHIDAMEEFNQDEIKELTAALADIRCRDNDCRTLCWRFWE